MRDAGCGMRDAGCGMRDAMNKLRNTIDMLTLILFIFGHFEICRPEQVKKFRIEKQTV
jgi:hypothetical protein